MKNGISRQLAVIAVLLTLVLLIGCGSSTDQEAPAESTVPEAEPSKSPEEIAAEQERRERLNAQKDGFLFDKGYLYAVDGEGDLIRDGYVGVLYFGEDGRYTSGSQDLDRLVAGVIRKNTKDDMTRMEMLHTMYEYTRDNIKYVGFGNHDYSYEPAHGKDGCRWLNEEHDLFYKSKDDIGGTTGLGYMQYIDPFEAERIEAEERSNAAAASKNPGITSPAGSITGTDNNAAP